MILRFVVVSVAARTRTCVCACGSQAQRASPSPMFVTLDWNAYSQPLHCWHSLADVIQSSHSQHRQSRVFSVGADGRRGSCAVNRAQPLLQNRTTIHELWLLPLSPVHAPPSLALSSGNVTAEDDTKHCCASCFTWKQIWLSYLPGNWKKVYFWIDFIASHWDMRIYICKRKRSTVKESERGGGGLISVP